MRLPVVRVLLILLALFSANAFAQESKRGHGTDAGRIRAKVYEPLIASTAQRYNADPYLLWTIAYLESRFRSDAVSYKNGKPCAYGIMQFTIPTALRYGLTNPQDPREAIDAAARYVRDLQMRFGPRADLILAAYNAGEGTVEAFRDGKTLVLRNNKIINPLSMRTGGIPPFHETQRYVAQGRIIYGKLTRAAIFHATTSVDKTSQDNARSNPTRLNTERKDSFYSPAGPKTAPAEPTIKPTRSNTINSIYVH
jgi:soluble lytic murein transglycosylase-like protein